MVFELVSVKLFCNVLYWFAVERNTHSLSTPSFYLREKAKFSIQKIVYNAKGSCKSIVIFNVLGWFEPPFAISCWIWLLMIQNTHFWVIFALKIWSVGSVGAWVPDIIEFSLKSPYWGISVSPQQPWGAASPHILEGIPAEISLKYH